MPSKVKTLDPATLALRTVSAIPVGAVGHGLSGLIGRCGISFFSPAMASAAGTFLTFAGVGLIALPLTVIPSYITRHLLDKTEFAKKHPHLATFLKDTADLLFILGAVAVGAAVFSSSFPVTIMALMILPTAYYALKTLHTVISACLEKKPEPAPTPTV